MLRTDPQCNSRKQSKKSSRALGRSYLLPPPTLAQRRHRSLRVAPLLKHPLCWPTFQVIRKLHVRGLIPARSCNERNPLFCQGTAHTPNNTLVIPSCLAFRERRGDRRSDQ